jgi:ferritin
MLKEVVFKELNVQINLEYYSSNLYFLMSSWCKAKELDGAAGFLMAHANEELAYMHKLFNYINETGGQAIVSGIESPENQFKDLKDIFEQTYKHEKYIATKINELVELTLNQKDYATFNFLQWYLVKNKKRKDDLKRFLTKVILLV